MLGCCCGLDLPSDSAMGAAASRQQCGCLLTMQHGQGKTECHASVASSRILSTAFLVVKIRWQNICCPSYVSRQEDLDIHHGILNDWHRRMPPTFVLVTFPLCAFCLSLLTITLAFADDRTAVTFRVQEIGRDGHVEETCLNIMRLPRPGKQNATEMAQTSGFSHHESCLWNLSGLRPARRNKFAWCFEGLCAHTPQDRTDATSVKTTGVSVILLMHLKNQCHLLPVSKDPFRFCCCLFFSLSLHRFVQRCVPRSPVHKADGGPPNAYD